MTLKIFALGVVAAVVLGGCATYDPKPFARGTECFYPSCAIDVRVVDDGKGGKKLVMSDDGNVIMGTRHKVVAIVWNMRTPGYVFLPSSVGPYTGRGHPDWAATGLGTWQQGIITHPSTFDSISVTNLNNDRAQLNYELTAYPMIGTDGPPLTAIASIMNDPCPNGAWACR